MHLICMLCSIMYILWPLLTSCEALVGTRNSSTSLNKRDCVFENMKQYISGFFVDCHNNNNHNKITIYDFNLIHHLEFKSQNMGTMEASNKNILAFHHIITAATLS